MNQMNKILILTDSIASPRPVPASEETILEETYPYLLRKDLKIHYFINYHLVISQLKRF